MLPKKRKATNEGCKHGYITKSDDGWYVCSECHEELRYNPNKRPVNIGDIYSEMMRQQRWKQRMKGLTKWLGPFEDELLLVDFQSFINEYTGLYPNRKNLISKDYILYHLLRKRGYDISRLQVKVPKMEKTLIQNETICRTIFEALNWTWPQV